MCLSTIISFELHIRSLPYFVHASYGRGSVLHWWRSDTLRNFGFADDVIFAHKLRLLDVAARLRQWGAHVRSLGLGAEEYPLQAADARDYFLQSGPTRPQWACWIFITLCLHTMPLRISEKKMACVTPPLVLPPGGSQVAAPGAESAVTQSMTALLVLVCLLVSWWLLWHTEFRHGRPHIGANGVSWPPGKWWKIKKRKHAKKSSVLCSCYILRESWQTDVDQADHIYIPIYFRMHHFVVKFSKKKFLRLRRQGSVEPLTKIPLTFLNFGANKHAFTGIYIWQYTKYP